MGPTTLPGKESVEEKIVLYYVTSAFIEKEYQKIAAPLGWSSAYIPRLFSSIYRELILEEMWNILKKFKNPIIDFKQLNYHIRQKIKNLKPEIFEW